MQAAMFTDNHNYPFPNNRRRYPQSLTLRPQYHLLVTTSSLRFSMPLLWRLSDLLSASRLLPLALHQLQPILRIVRCAKTLQPSLRDNVCRELMRSWKDPLHRVLCRSWFMYFIALNLAQYLFYYNLLTFSMVWRNECCQFLTSPNRLKDDDIQPQTLLTRFWLGFIPGKKINW